MFPGMWLFCFSLLVLAARGSNQAIVTNGDVCSCRKSCSEQPDLEEPNSQQHEIADISIPSSSPSSFYFDVTLSSCVHLPRWCKTSLECIFPAKADCEARCGSVARLGEDKVDGDSDVAKAGSKLGGCQSTKFGCCSDGSTRTEIGLCRSMDQAGGVGSSGVRWDLVVSGVCVMVLLVMVLTVTGLFTFDYRRKKRERIRSRYIHNVLEMYDSSDSDSSYTDGERGRRSGTRPSKHHRLEL